MWAAILTLSGMCSIFVNIVNHRLADGGVNCTCGNNMTQRMLLFTAFRWHFCTGRKRGKTGRLCLWHKQPVFEWLSKMLSPSLTIEPPFSSHTSCVTLKWDPASLCQSPSFQTEIEVCCSPDHLLPYELKTSHCTRSANEIILLSSANYVLLKI